jgi:cytidylate kinase
MITSIKGDGFMPVIIVSSDSYASGAQVAEGTAKVLRYQCFGREILRAIGEKYRVSEEKLLKSLDERPSLLGVGSKTRSLYLAYIEEAVLARLSEDDVVCHGLAAHLYVLGISHVLKVRVLANPEEMIHETMEKKGVSREKAARVLRREEALRKRWSLDNYRLDETSPSLYDLVINLSSITPDEAVKMIAETSSHRKFQTMTFSVKCIKDLELASRVRAALYDHFPDITTQADGSKVVIETAALPREKEKRAEAIEKLALTVPGVDHVEVRVVTDIIREAAESFR